jgi:hypothetical protein
MRRSPLAPALVLASLAMASGCAAPGPFPSLAQRPAEREYAAERVDAPKPPPAPLPDDPAVAARVGALVAEARAGDAEFDRAYASAAAAAGRAGGPGSDSWVEAQQALSRATAAQAGTGKALADLDAYSTQRAQAGGLSAADMNRLREAGAQVQAIAEGQHARIDRLEAMLRR